MLNLLTRSPFTRGKALLVCVGLISLMSCSKGNVASPAPDSNTSQTEATTDTVANPQVQESEASASTAPSAQSNSSTSTQSEESDSDVFVNLVAGRQYAEARNQLMRQGWIPANLPAPGPYGVERMAYEAGFTEVSACAGTGLGQCRFEFRHDSANKVLSVITVGGSALEVSDWSISTPVDGAPTAPTSTPADIAAVPAPAVIPAAFQGEWNANPADCAANPPTTGRLIVQLNKLEFWETTSAVELVDRRSDREIVVTAEAYSEGETFMQTKTLRLSEDDWSLTDIETGAVWRRCVGRLTGVPTAAAPTTATSQELAEIPGVYQGQWNSSLEQCGTPYSDGRLTITADRYAFWETTGTVSAVSVTGEREIAVTANVSSEGSSSQETITFGMSEDASFLTHGDGFVKYRCPS